MSVDELATAVVVVEADDLVGLGQIHAALNQMLADPAQAALAPTIAQAAACVERIILREPDASQCLAELAGLVARLVEPDMPPATMPQANERAATDGGSTPSPTDADSKATGQPRIAGASTPSPSLSPADGSCAGAGADLSADPALLADFVTESLDHIQNAETSLLALESDPSDDESINAVFRAFHTIKGTSGFLNLAHIQRLAHRAETLLDRARQGQIRLTGGYADLALESADLLKRMISELSTTGGRDAAPGLDDLVDRLANPEAAGISQSQSEATSAAPRVGDLLVATGKVDRAQVEAVADRQPIGQALVASGAATASDVAGALRMQKKIASGESPSAAVGADSTIRVGTQRLDGLINLVGELVITQAMISQASAARSHTTDPGFARNISQLGKITRELQDLGMSLRMVPLKNTFQKMARLVRDLARKSGKHVQFVTEGEDTEIDRGMVETLNDPLVHMIRNAVDHGLEGPQDRQSAGKAACGTVRLRAYHAAGSVAIELADDGRGLNKDRILRKATDKGLVGGNEELSENEIFRLIFAPGFSTAEQVTDVSGRGVGMDVVKRNLDSLRGRIDIASTLGAGTTFTLRVPLTLAIIDGMLVRVGAQRYVLPTMNIRQAFRPTAAQVKTLTGRGEMVVYQGRTIPIFQLFELFEVAGATRTAGDSLLVVVEDDASVCALRVDELLGQQQVVIKSLGRGVGRTPGVSGGAILADGRVGLILDVQGLVAMARDGQCSESHADLATVGTA